MARITWQNVTAPDLSTSRAALQSAGNSFDTGFQNFIDTFRDVEQQQKDAYSQEALARLAQVTDPNQMNQMMASGGLASLGITDPRYLNADAMESILGRPKTLFDNQNTAMNTANVQSQLNERNALLPGKLAEQVTNRAYTQALTANQLQETDFNRQKFPEELKKQTLDNEELEIKIEKLDAEISQIEGQTSNDADANARANAEADALKKQRDQVINSKNINAEIGKFKTLKEARDAWPDLQKKIEENPDDYTEELIQYINNGPEAAVGQRLSLAADADSTAAANSLWNTIRFGPDFAGSTRDQLARKIELSDVSREAKNKALTKLENVSEDLFTPSAAAKALVTRSTASASGEFKNTGSLVNPYNASILTQKQALNRNARSNPFFEFAKFWEGEKDNAISGAAQKLNDELIKEEDVFSGAPNRKVIKIINQVSNELPDIPKDVIAYFIQSGAANDYNYGVNLFRGDADISKNKLKQAIQELYKEENMTIASQSYADWKEKSNALSQIDAAAQKAIATAELQLTQGADEGLVMDRLNKILQGLTLPEPETQSQPTIEITPFSSDERTPMDFKTRQNLNIPAK